MSTPTQTDFIDAIRKDLNLSPGGVDWAFLKLVSDRLKVCPRDLVVDGSPIITEPEAAILVGHTAGTGYYAVDGQEEWHFNSPIAIQVVLKLEQLGVKAVIVPRTIESYSLAMKHYAKVINAIPTIKAAVEMHFNAAGPSAHGFEHLYTGVAGRGLATALNLEHADHHPWQRNRGVKRPWMGRGAPFMRSLKCACSLIEPAFGSNLDEWTRFSKEQDAYSSAVAQGIYNYLRK